MRGEGICVQPNEKVKLVPHLKPLCQRPKKLTIPYQRKRRNRSCRFNCSSPKWRPEIPFPSLLSLRQFHPCEELYLMWNSMLQPARTDVVVANEAYATQHA